MDEIKPLMEETSPYEESYNGSSTLGVLKYYEQRIKDVFGRNDLQVAALMTIADYLHDLVYRKE